MLCAAGAQGGTSQSQIEQTGNSKTNQKQAGTRESELAAFIKPATAKMAAKLVLASALAALYCVVLGDAIPPPLDAIYTVVEGGALGEDYNSPGTPFSIDSESVARLFGRSYAARDIRPSRISTWWGDYNGNRVLTGLQLEYVDGSGTKMTSSKYGKGALNPCVIEISASERVTVLEVRSGRNVDFIRALAAPGVPLVSNVKCGNENGGYPTTLQLHGGDYFFGFAGGSGSIVDYIKPLKAYMLVHANALAGVATATPSAIGQALGSPYSSGGPAEIAALLGEPVMTISDSPSYVQTFWSTEKGETALQGFMLSFTDAARPGDERDGPLVGKRTTNACIIDLNGPVQELSISGRDNAPSVVGAIRFKLGGATWSSGCGNGTGRVTSVSLSGNDYFIGFQGNKSKDGLTVQPLKAFPSGGVAPTPMPSTAPSAQPTSQPTSPSSAPTSPTALPTARPTAQPSKAPSAAPTTAMPTTAAPVTASPTTASPTTASPTVPEPIPPAPTSPPSQAPTTACSAFKTQANCKKQGPRCVWSAKKCKAKSG